MDFKKTFQHLKETVTPLVQKTGPIIEKARDYGEKALDFTLEQAATTPMFLQDEETYNIHMSLKRSILVAYDESDETIKNLALLFPIWGTKAWMDTASLKFLSLTKNRDLAKTLNISGPIEMRVAYNGKEYLKTNTLEEIKSWWENRCYTDEVSTPPSSEKTDTPQPVHDPLSENEK